MSLKKLSTCGEKLFMIKLLLLSAGTNACFHVAKTLQDKYKGKFYIIGADINEEYLIPTIGYLNAFYKVPPTKAPGYYEAIIDICKKEKADVILPSFDEDQKLFNPDNPDLQALGIKSLGTTQKSLSVYADKVRTYEFMNSHNLPLPRLFQMAEVCEDKAYFIKPKNGCASIGTRKICGHELLNFKEYSNFLIQEVCSEPEFTLECFYYHNRLFSVARERIAAKAGVCVKARVFKNEKLHAIAERFVSVLETPLYFNLQFMNNADGCPVITDVNLRLAGGMSLSYAAGWDEVSALADILLEKDDEEVFSHISAAIPEQFVVRAYTDIVTKKL